MGTIAIIGKNKPLHDLLEQEDADLFLLCGGTASAAQKVFDFMRAAPESFDSWQHIFLIRATAEKQTWFGADASDRYVVLRGAANKKQVTQQGPASDLLTSGYPDILSIIDAFIS